MPASLLALKVAALLFMLFSVGHVVRLVGHLDLSVAGHVVPLWVSLFGAMIGAGLAVWMWWAAHPRKPPAETQ